MRTKKDVQLAAMKQLAKDFNCDLTDFEKRGVVLTPSGCKEGARSFDGEDSFLKIACFANTAIISADEALHPWIKEELLAYNPDWLFDHGTLRMIDKKLQAFGHEIRVVKDYYLPNPEVNMPAPSAALKWFEQEDILQFKGDDRFGEAFIFDESAPDVLGVACCDGDDIMGMAGSSADSDVLYQVGIDVLPDYRGKRLGSMLVAQIKQELLSRGKVPFYGTALSHIGSRNIAVNAGFYPGWAELVSRKMKK